MTYLVTEHKWWNADKTVLLPNGHPDAAFLAYPAGTDLAESEAIRLGLLAAPPPVVVEARDIEDVEPKVRRATPANKLGSAPANKAGKTIVEETL